MFALLAVVLLLVIAAVAWGAGWFVNLLLSDEPGAVYRPWLPWACAGGSAVALLLPVPFFLFMPDAEWDTPDEFSLTDRLMRREQQVAGAVMIGVLLTLPRMIAEAIRGRHAHRGWSDAQLRDAEAVVAELFEANDWLPIGRYFHRAEVVARLVKTDVLWVKEFRDDVVVRLDPGLFP